MIFTTDTLTPQLTELLQHYPDLKIISQKDNEVIAAGNISVFMKHPMYILRKTYGIKIVIPLNSEELPYVVDKDNYISKSYHHYYSTGKLCLETDSAIRLRFVDGFDLVAWMTEYVETYFFSYEYYMRYNYFPFGERSHGLDGVLQTYLDVFKTKDPYAVLRIMSYISLSPYRGHNNCPCGSNLKLRNCHGETILPFFTHPKKKEILKNDYEIICEEVKRLGRNQKQTKRA